MTVAHPIRNIEIQTLAKIQKLSRRLARQIQDDHYKPEIVVAISRGGFVPARLLCDYLDIYNLTCIRITHYTGTDITGPARLSIPLNVDVHGMPILLVDDVDDTGDTLQLALAHLHEFNPSAIRVAVLHHKTVSNRVPDYYAEKVTHWRWITYPWALTEDVLSMVRKMQPPPSCIEEAIMRMARDHGLRIPDIVMQDVFRLLGAEETSPGP